MAGRSARAIRFGVFEVDLQAGELRKNGLKIRIQEQPLQILAVLLERPGEVVTREDLRQRLWPTDTFVDFDHSLNTAVNKLRESLGDSADSPRFVETLPRRGYRFIAPVELLGEDLTTPTPGQPEPPPTPPTRTRRLLPWERIAFIAGLVVAVGIIAAMWLSRRGTVSDAPVERFTFAPEGGATSPVISPNGKHIAYLSGTGEDAKVMVQDLDRFAPREIPGSKYAKNYLFWSPDSNHIGFAEGGRLWKAPALGGDPVTICQLGGEYLGGAWSPDGLAIVFAVTREGLYDVPARGGTPKLIVPLDMNRWGDHFEHPWFLPAGGGGRVLLYTAQTHERTHVTVLHSLESGEQRIVAPDGLGVFSPTGHVVYGYGNRSLLWALPFSSKTMKVTGEAFPIAATAVFASASVSLDGTLAYLESGDRWQLNWRDRKGVRLSGMDQPGMWIESVSLSPDGDSAAVASVASGDEFRTDIWIRSLSRGTNARLTSEPTVESHPIWDRSGSTITFFSNRRGNWDIFSKPADGRGTATPLVAGPLDENPEDWSPDGSVLVYYVVDPQRAADIWYLKRKEDGSYEPVPFLQTPFQEFEAVLSPDGRFLAYVSNESGTGEVYVQRFPEGGAKQQISINGGQQPRWRKDGTELFYVAGETLMAAPVTIGSHFSSGVPGPLFKNTGLAEDLRRYDVSSDGRRFLIAERAEESAKPVIRVVRNWFTEFRDRPPDGQ